MGRASLLPLALSLDDGPLELRLGALGVAFSTTLKTTLSSFSTKCPAAGHGAEAVRKAITCTIASLPEQLRRSLTWDQGAEMAEHTRLRIDAGLQVYFCDPRSPWQRGTNENTNGLLRQCFPRGTDLSAHSAEDLAAVAEVLNSRPRKTLSWKTPAEALDAALTAIQDSVATTA